jgi:hypothetical protein
MRVAFEFFQHHASGLCRFVRIMDPKTGVGETPGVSLRHPAKERFHRSLG